MIYRVECRFPPPFRMLQVHEFDTEAEAVKFAKAAEQMAEQLRTSGSKDAIAGGKLTIYRITDDVKYFGDRTAIFMWPESDEWKGQGNEDSS